MEELFFALGHLVLFGVKCHPEIAGLGVEYIWGTRIHTCRIVCVCVHLATSHSHAHTSKRLFRNRFNDESGKNLESNVWKCIVTPKYAVCVGPLFGKDHLKDRNENDLPAPMTNALVRRFARRTRNYERI